MKRLLYLIAFALPGLLVTSCNHDDSDLPDVNFVVELENAVYHHDTIYCAQADTFNISSVQVVNNEPNKRAVISYAEYFWDFMRVGVSDFAPYAFHFNISDQVSLGNHTLQIYAPVYAVGKEPAFAIVTYPVKVVASAADLPADGSVTLTSDAIYTDQAVR